jgi:hypothetical protein
VSLCDRGVGIEDFKNFKFEVGNMDGMDRMDLMDGGK